MSGQEEGSEWAGGREEEREEEKVSGWEGERERQREREGGEPELEGELYIMHVPIINFTIFSFIPSPLPPFPHFSPPLPFPPLRLGTWCT